MVRSADPSRESEVKQQITFPHSDYELTVYENGRVWLSHWTGEGMELGEDSQKEIAALISKFYQENF